MQIQLLVPSQNQKRFPLEVKKTATVSQLRKRVANAVKVPENGFLLITFGKIMLDKSADGKAATLFLTYRIRDKTCVFVHIAKPKSSKPNKVTTQVTQRNKVAASTQSARVPQRRIILSNNIVSTPFDGSQCSICDQCDNYWHTHCAGLTRVPIDQYWFCPDCINEDGKLIIGKGEAVKNNTSQRNQIVIRDMDCVLVPVYHVGKIPGIYCGQSWEYRSSVYDWGVHRAAKAHVAGTSSTGAVSILLSKGLKEDQDLGYEFVFSGIGGQLRTRKYSDVFHMVRDQTLTKYNNALAVTCSAQFDEEFGAKAHRWRKSRPIRVCRTSRRKHTHPTYAPMEGIRYDGLYKIVKYWPQKDKTSGFIIWKFLFRRDDQEPPPWMSYAKRIMSKRGLRLIKSDDTEKLVRYMIPARIQRLMKADLKNKRLWDEISKMEFWSEYEFLHYLFDTAVVCSGFVCSKPIKDPVTTPCGHICCVNCLAQSETDSCFTCRTQLPKKPIQVNDKLKRILQSLNWAYDIENTTKTISVPLPSNFENFDKDIVKCEDEGQTPIEIEDYVEYGIKQEFEYPTLADSIQTEEHVKVSPKKVRVFIEYLGDLSTEQNKKRKLGN